MSIVVRAGSRSAAQRMCAIAATKWPQPPSTGLTAALCTGSIRSAALFSAAAMKAADALVVQQCATARVITGGLARLSAGKDARRRHRNLGGAIYRSTSSFHPSFRTDDLQTAYRLTPPTPIYRVDGREFSPQGRRRSPDAPAGGSEGRRGCAGGAPTRATSDRSRRRGVSRRRRRHVAGSPMTCRTRSTCPLRRALSAPCP